MLQAQGVESEAPFSDESEVEIAMIGEKGPAVTSVTDRLSSAMVSKTAPRIGSEIERVSWQEFDRARSRMI